MADFFYLLEFPLRIYIFRNFRDFCASEMHCHLYRVSTSLVPASPPSPHPTPFQEHNVNLTYNLPSTVPILTSTIYTVPTKPFHVKCRREGDASDIDITDLLFEVFLDGVWIGGCTLRDQGPKAHASAKRAIVASPPSQLR